MSWRKHIESLDPEEYSSDLTLKDVEDYLLDIFNRKMRENKNKTWTWRGACPDCGAIIQIDIDGVYMTRRWCLAGCLNILAEIDSHYKRINP